MEAGQGEDFRDIIRVLHVDDEPNTLRFCKMFLEMIDPSIRVVSSISPGEATGLLKERRFDCIVSDYQMPEEDGVEFARRVREESEVPFILYTGKGSEEVAEAAFSAGVDDYLRKELDPSSFQVLANRIRQVVKKHRIEELYRNVVEGSRDPIVIVVRTKIVYANQAAADLYGADSVEEILGRDAQDFTVEEDREEVRERALGRQRGEPEPRFYEFSVRRKDGEVWIAEVSASRVNYMGKPATLAFVRNVTDRKRLEETMRVKDHALRSSINAVALADLAGNLTYVNESFLFLWGYDDEEDVLGRPTVSFWEADEEASDMLEALIQGRSWEGELVARGRGSSRFQVQLSASLVKDNDGRLLCFMASFVDVTERKVAERELVEYTSHLREIVEERTRELMDAERMVAAGRVASMVGHDLRGPLQTIKNAVYLLERTPEKMGEMLEVITQASDYAVDMLEELRSATRDSPLNVEETDLGDLVSRAMEEVSPGPSVEVETDIGGGLEQGALDPLKIRRVLDNLIRNALEAMHEGGTLTVRAWREGGEAKIEVGDTGVGIPESLLPDLFKPFHTTKPGGLGLGLAYCKRAVEAHGGRITVQSTEGRGTTFTVTLPLQQP